MPFQQPHSESDKDRRRQEPAKHCHAEHPKIPYEKHATDHNQRDTSPELSLFNGSELLLKAIDGCFQFNSLHAQSSLLRCVVSLERHVHIEAKDQHPEQRIRKSELSLDRDERSKNQDVDCRFNELAVINSADTGNQTERKGSTGIGPDHGFMRSNTRRRRFWGHKVCEATLAINAAFHVANALITNRLPTTNAKGNVLRFRVIRAIHQEISIRCSIRDSISVTSGER